LGEEHRRRLFENLGPRVFLLLDGADLLRPFAWRRVRRASLRAGGLVVTSHRKGLLPALHRPRTSPDLLDTMVRTLAGTPPERFGESAQALFDRHGGNLRTALRELYDVCATLPPSSELRLSSDAPRIDGC